MAVQRQSGLTVGLRRDILCGAMKGGGTGWRAGLTESG
jgi:hypothetical protein